MPAKAGCGRARARRSRPAVPGGGGGGGGGLATIVAGSRVVVEVQQVPTPVTVVSQSVATLWSQRSMLEEVGGGASLIW